MKQVRFEFEELPYETLSQFGLTREMIEDVKDDDVDRRQVYRQRCHSRALLIARNFGRRQAGYAKSGLLFSLRQKAGYYEAYQGKGCRGYHL